MKHVLSYGGGVNSSALFFYILQKKLPLDIVIFADTGEETKETYNAVNRMKSCCKKANVEFVTAKSDKGRLVDYYMMKKAVPSIMKRDCTSKFKVAPIRKYLRGRFGKKETFGQYIGIAWDELHRAVISDVKYITNLYPFIDARIKRDGNQEIIDQNNFKASKSGCAGCMFMNKNGFMKLKKIDPVDFKRWMAMEENGSRYPEITLNPKFQLRGIWEQTVLFDDDTDDDPGCGSINCFL